MTNKSISFHLHFERKGPDDCWIWTGAKTGRGYSSFTIKLPNGNRKTRAAHIIMYEQEIGPVPVGKVLDHTCKVRACVNPNHLEPVTNLENIRRGKRCKITKEVAEQIRLEYAERKANKTELGFKYKLHPSTICDIINHSIWR